MAENTTVNKVVINNETVMDITDTTATPESVAEGQVFYKASGERSTGTMVETDPVFMASPAYGITSSDITNWDTIKYKVSLTAETTIPANSNLNDTKWLKTGSYANPSNAATSTISNIPSGLIEAFMLNVYSPLSGNSTADDVIGNWIYRLQEITVHSGTKRWVRLCNTDGNGVWTYRNWTRIYPAEASSISGTLGVDHGGTGAATAADARTNLGLGSVENKSSATIRSELTKSNVTTALGFTPYTPAEVDVLVSAVFHYKGTKATYAEVAALTGMKVGDVWQVTADNSEYVYNGSTWEKLGPTIDLSGYLTSVSIAGQTLTPSSNTITAAQLKTALGLGGAAYKDVETTVANDAKLPTGAAVKSFVEGKGYTTNTGTVTKVSTGVGLTGGDVTTSGTIKAKLKSETASTLDSSTMGSTASRQYAVGVDKSGYLSVNIPWENTQTLTGVKGNSESSYRTGNVNITAANIGLGNVENKSSATIRGELTKANVTDALGYTPPTTDTDTKNTAGSTDTSSKIFLIGATSQAANPQTYSDNEVYATNGVLTTKAVQVGGTKATMQYNATTNTIDFIFA